MQQCSEVTTIGPVLALATSDIDYLDDIVEVQGVQRPPNVLDVVGGKGVVTVLTVQPEETNVMLYRSIGVQLKMNEINEFLDQRR